MAKKVVSNFHVLPHSQKGWAVKEAGSERNSKLFEKQTDAILFARQKARSGNTELFIHAKNGRIRERNTYGRDTYLPKN